VLLTRSPLEHPRKGLSVRLACVKHAASVRPEPGSNSPNKNPRDTPGKNSNQNNLTKQKTPKLASKKPHPHKRENKKGMAKKQQQNKTTKHTIEFSNNTL
jgi:hypothetical protein